MRGLQDNGIMACGKHFAGHGNTETDSHKDLPEINKSLAELKNLELYPFQSMIDNGIQSMMVAHLQVPALDKKSHAPPPYQITPSPIYLKMTCISRD